MSFESAGDAERQLSKMVAFDLMDFGNGSLSESGELEVPRYFKDNV